MEQVMRMNRVFVFVLVLVLAVTLLGVSGCKKPLPAPKIGLVFDIGGRGDLSFNDSAYAGLEKAQNELGVDVTYQEPAEGGANREELLRTLAEEGYELIFAIGFLFSDAVAAAAADFPDTKFALVDGWVPGLEAASNLVCLGFSEHEASFLVGVAAAFKTETDKLGFVGGMEGDLIRKFEVGFKAGAKHVNPDIDILVQYIGSTPEAFANPTAGRELGLAQIGRGADILYHASGKSGIGVISAAAERGKLAIGVDSDQYLVYGDPVMGNPAEQPFIYTSMIKRVDVAVFDTIKAFVEDRFEGGYVTFNVANGGLDYAVSNAALIGEFVEQIDAIKAMVASGEIVVPSTYAEYDAFIAGLGG